MAIDFGDRFIEGGIISFIHMGITNTSVPRYHVLSDLERALLDQRPVATKVDKEGRPIPSKGPVPLSAAAFQERHDGSLDAMNRQKFDQSNGIPPEVAIKVEGVLSSRERKLFE